VTLKNEKALVFQGLSIVTFAVFLLSGWPDIAVAQAMHTDDDLRALYALARIMGQSKACGWIKDKDQKGVDDFIIYVFWDEGDKYKQIYEKEKIEYERRQKKGQTPESCGQIIQAYKSMDFEALKGETGLARVSELEIYFRESSGYAEMCGVDASEYDGLAKQWINDRSSGDSMKSLRDQTLVSYDLARRVQATEDKSKINDQFCKKSKKDFEEAFDLLKRLSGGNK
jgi:hypothetical protein